MTKNNNILFQIFFLFIYIYIIQNDFKLIYINIILFLLYKYYIIKIGKVKDIKQYIKNRF